VAVAVVVEPTAAGVVVTGLDQERVLEAAAGWPVLPA
jgi:hypothetical protein